MPGAKGKTLEDQRKIDRVMAGACSARILLQAKCSQHTTASAQRKAELNDG